MSEKPFNMDEFMQQPETDFVPEEVAEEVDETSVDEEVEAPELEVQQAVVQELAADKAALAADFESLKAHNAEVEAELKETKKKLAAIQKDRDDVKELLSTSNAVVKRSMNMVLKLQAELAEQRTKEMDLQERKPNALALLDRDVELPDRFPGETRDHVLEVIAEARAKAEEDGRIRRAQLLEGVLVANDPNGNLAKKRAALEKYFNENHNIMTGPVMAELDKCGISYKKGDEYLLPSEILKRTY